MTRDEIIRMAREVGLFVPHEGIPENGAFMRFATLLIAAEREACAKVAEDCAGDCYIGDADWEEAKRCAKAIRARGNV